MLQKFDERNRDLIVNINGELMHRDKAGISPFDSAVQGGDAVWEGLRLYNGRIFKLHEHLDRLERSAKALSFAEIPAGEKIVEEIKRTLARSSSAASALVGLAEPVRPAAGLGRAGVRRERCAHAVRARPVVARARDERVGAAARSAGRRRMCWMLVFIMQTC